MRLPCHEVKKDDLWQGNVLSKCCSPYMDEFMTCIDLTLSCLVGGQYWPKNKDNHKSKTKDLTPKYFCTVICGGKIYNFYLRTLTLTCTPDWSKWPTCMPSVKTLSPKKTTFFGKMPSINIVALIPTNSKLSLNLLWAFPFARYDDFPVRVTSDNESYKGFCQVGLLVGIPSEFSSFFAKRWPILEISSRGVP